MGFEKMHDILDTVGTVKGSVPRMPRVSCKNLHKKSENFENSHFSYFSHAIFMSGQ